MSHDEKISKEHFFILKNNVQILCRRKFLYQYVFPYIQFSSEGGSVWEEPVYYTRVD